MTALIRIDRSWTPAGSGRHSPIRFCSRCGHPAEERHGRADPRRVCPRCEMGVLLACAREALPGAGAAFLICSYDLRVSAVSRAAERIFGREERLVGRGLLDLVTSPLGDDQLARHAGLAAQRPTDTVVLPLRLASGSKSRRIGTLAARISGCGPPRAALVTVEPSEFGRR